MLHYLSKPPPMTTFNPGPSQQYDSIPGYLQDACTEGILSMGHRGARFQQLYEAVLQGFRDKLGLPQDYSLYFFGSATECWQVLAEGIISKNALHAYSGAFGQRWYEYAQHIVPGVQSLPFGVDTPFAQLQGSLLQPVEMVCFTHNETSNGSQVPLARVAEVRAVLQEQLIAIDATSSMGGQQLPWTVADVWFASVQKCFGMPAGLAVMACSPHARKRMATIAHTGRYNGLMRVHQYWETRQTSYTPNVLAIYLLGRVLADATSIADTDSLLQQRAQRYYALLEAHPVLQPHVQLAASRSVTTIAVDCPPELLDKIKADALALGLQLGNGYKPLHTGTFRIANFPAIQQEAVDRLCQFIEQWNG